MKFEPRLDRPALIETLRQAYGFPVVSLDFIPEGMVGCHYAAVCADGFRHFVTVLLPNAMAQLQIARLDFNLVLMDMLRQGGLFEALPAVRRTLSGALKAEFQGQPLIVYEFIPGASLAGVSPYPPDVLQQLGGLLARLHTAAIELGLTVPFVERFELPFEQPLISSLAALARLSSRERPARLALRDFVLPRQGTILALLERLHALRRQARLLGTPHRLVHTDITPWNLMRTPQGDLFIVDWEGVMLAPAEADLFIFPQESFPTLLRAYLHAPEFVGHAPAFAAHASAAPRLHPELFVYYFHRRSLEDLAYFILPILQEQRTEEEDRFDLDLLQADCAAGWPFLEICQDWASAQIQAYSY